MAKDKRFIVSLKPSKHQELKEYSVEHKKTMNSIVKQSLREFLIKHGVETKPDIEDNDGI